MNGRDQTAASNAGFLLLLALLTLALAVIVLPFARPLFWAALAGIMFQPLHNWFLALWPGKENRAAGMTLLVITIAVIIPAFMIGSAILEQAVALVVAFQEGRIDIGLYFEQVVSALPASIRASLDNAGLGNLAAIQDRAQTFAQESLGMIAQRAIAIGSGVASWVLAFAIGLYASFFLIRDGRTIGQTVLRSLPLSSAIAERLSLRFLAIVRATVKGSVVVGLVQGAIGAITFWIVGIPSVMLLGLAMAIASLLPAVGTALIWAPVAIYLLATGSIWEGLLVLVSGVAIIGMVDNVLRPVLVGRDTGIPDWLILVTTLGGLALIGLSGIIVGPLVCGLFLTGWAIYRESREQAEPVPAEEVP